MSKEMRQTVDDVRAIAAGMPAKYEKETQANQRERRRVSEFHELSADAALHGGDSVTVMPEGLDMAVMTSKKRLDAAKRATFDTTYRDTLAADLRLAARGERG
jgi:hypothetical protein